MKIRFAFVFLLSAPFTAAQQAPLQLNAPYHCANNIIVVVKNCGMKNGAEVCSLVKGPANGPLSDEISVPKAQAAAIGLICQPPSGGASQTTAKGAQTMNPAYLSEMPMPARILSEIKGKDAEDTGERQMGAFRALVDMVDEMAWGLSHRYVNDADNRAATPAERRLRLAYETAYADLWHKVTNKEGHIYDHDLDLRNELLQKFFSDNFRTQYFQSDRNAVAGYKAFQERMYRSSANIQPTQVSSQNAEASAASGGQQATKTAVAPDPSIAKAHAASVDTRVFGIPLGEPLQVPTCTSMFDSSKTCLQKEVSSEMVDTLTSFMTAFGAAPAAPTKEDTRIGVRIVELTSDACPSWLSDCTARLMTYDGLLVAVSMNTKGHNVDQAAAKDLRSKYGSPTSVRPLTVTPRVGNPFKASDLEWQLPGLHVVYEFATKGQSEGEIVNAEVGSLGIETEAAYQRRLAREKQKPKPTL